MLPHVLKDFNLFIDGRGYAGLAEEITLPKLVMQTSDYQAAGMLGPVKLDLGLEGLSLEFTLGEFNDDVLAQWGVDDPSGIGARFMGALVAGDGSGTKAIEISVRGRWEELDPGQIKKKEQAKLKVKMALTYYRYTSNGVVIHDIDMISGKAVVNGKDLFGDVLNAIGQVV